VSQDFLQLIQSGDAEQSRPALENDLSLAQYRDAQESLRCFGRSTQPRKVSLLLMAKLATLSVPLDVLKPIDW